MKGSKEIIDLLNALLADELTAINQYMVHSEMCENWGYERLHKAVEKRAFTEMHHAERLIERILFLEGTPVVSQLNPMHIGKDVELQLKNDHASEQTAIQNYNAGVGVCQQAKDNGTKELLEANLKDEEGHIDWLEAQMDQIAQMGIQNYLASQTE